MLSKLLSFFQSYRFFITAIIPPRDCMILNCIWKLLRIKKSLSFVSSNTNVSKQMISGLAMPMIKCASWTWDQHNSMQICENAENISPGLWIL